LFDKESSIFYVPILLAEIQWLSSLTTFDAATRISFV